MNLGNALSHHRTNYGRTLPTLDQLTASNQMVSSREGPKSALIKDVEERKFYYIVGEVIKTVGSSGGFELYVSDYTSNPRLFNYGRYGDEFNYIGRKEKKLWPGPYGKLTLEVTLWPPHSITAQSTVKEGDFVELRNVKMKLETSMLEGVIHTDRKYPDRVDVHALSTKDDRVKDVLRAKRS
jgi:protection of telomeres protein 1